MSVNKRIIEALNPFGIPVKPELYTGSEKTYVVFNYADDRGADYGDNTPQCTVAYMQVHLFMPLNQNGLALKKEIREALFGAGFTYPSVTILTEQENNIRHIIFECETEEEREE